MSLKVLKFGGSSLADAEHFRQVAEIIKSDHTRRYIVAFAPGKRDSSDTKVTDLLYKCYALASNEEDVTNVFNQIKQRYIDIINDLGIELDLTPAFEKIRQSLLHNTGRDYIASRGEYLNAMILAKFLGFDFIDAKKVIFFNEDGSFNADKTNEVMREALSIREYAVIPGFYGSMPNGTIKTFSRGGSDITGSIVARAASATLYENWTDVSGFLMADPRIIDNPKPIGAITYKELRELSYMGATVLHEDAIFPVRYSKIPINIRNTNRPEDKGTGRMIRFESGKEPVELWAGMGCTNGMGFSPDEKTFYHTETGKKSISAYDYDRETGEITFRNVVYQGDGKMGLPDGMTVDADGFIWSAFWNGYGVRRISPEGVIMAEMFVPACQTSSVMFGGEDLDTLYVTSGAQGAENLETGMFEGIFLGGPLYAFKPGVHGKVEYRSKI
jgi:aspartate kinase